MQGPAVTLSQSSGKVPAETAFVSKRRPGKITHLHHSGKHHSAGRSRSSSPTRLHPPVLPPASDKIRLALRVRRGGKAPRRQPGRTAVAVRNARGPTARTLFDLRHARGRFPDSPAARRQVPKNLDVHTKMPASACDILAGAPKSKKATTSCLSPPQTASPKNLRALCGPLRACHRSHFPPRSQRPAAARLLHFLQRPSQSKWHHVLPFAHSDRAANTTLSAVWPLARVPNGPLPSRCSKASLRAHAALWPWPLTPQRAPRPAARRFRPLCEKNAGGVRTSARAPRRPQPSESSRHLRHRRRPSSPSRPTRSRCLRLLQRFRPSPTSPLAEPVPAPAPALPPIPDLQAAEAPLPTPVHDPTAPTRRARWCGAWQPPRRPSRRPGVLPPTWVWLHEAQPGPRALALQVPMAARGRAAASACPPRGARSPRRRDGIPKWSPASHAHMVIPYRTIARALGAGSLCRGAQLVRAPAC